MTDSIDGDGYAFLRLGGSSGHWPDLAVGLQRSVIPAWNERGAEVCGVFSGLFGLQSNELIVLLFNGANVDLRALTDPVRNARVVRATRLRATARPTAFAPITKNGLYVFRNFRLRAGSIDETVRLSRQAWTTFAAGVGFNADPIGLFEELDVPAIDAENMLLLTWYDGFGSWEASRKPPVEAAENFRLRHALTTRTGAMATRLLSAH